MITLSARDQIIRATYGPSCWLPGPLQSNQTFNCNNRTSCCTLVHCLGKSLWENGEYKGSHKKTIIFFTIEGYYNQNAFQAILSQSRVLDTLIFKLKTTVKISIFFLFLKASLIKREWTRKTPSTVHHLAADMTLTRNVSKFVNTYLFLGDLQIWSLMLLADHALLQTKILHFEWRPFLLILQ